MQADLPSGTVTFLFTDVEGSTRLLHELGAEGYAEALAEHRRVVREACAAEGGVEVDTQGDAFFFGFPTAPGALAAASAFTEHLASGAISVRVGIHTGTPLVTEEGYVGTDVHRAARIGAAGHGGQVLVSASTTALAGADGLCDLGEHRFKDLSARERVYQLGTVQFPPLKTLYRTNLPIPATPFLGREAELAEVVELVTSGDLRLLTLTGPGGTGKTRLGLQAAAEASESFPDGVYWVPLASLRDPALVLATAGQILGSKNGLAEHIQDKQMLCLFDNFEQVVKAGPELADLVGACPNLGILVTSRERLRVGGEQTYPVPQLAESDGEELFLTRARAVDPAFAGSDAVRELCLRLDVLPLAIELAAARTAVFSPEQLLEKVSQRLDLLKGERDADPRQQTLRATIEWSYDLLSEDEQRLFWRLAVFAGGCTYEAAEEIAGADPDILQSLLDKSLVRKRDSRVGHRYWMLETIREYASERLDESGEAGELRQRHAEFFLALAEEAFPELKGSPGPWLDRLEADHDNLRTLLDWLESAGRTQEALQLAGALYRFWSMRGYLLEGRDRLERLLARELARTSARMRALHGAAVMASSTGDPETAEKRAEEARDLARTLGDAWGEAYAVYMLGTAATEREDWSGALPFFEASLDAFRRLGDDHYVLLAMDGIAWIPRMLGDRERSKRLHEETLACARASGDNGVVALQLWQLAGLANKEERTHEALAMLREALVLNRDEGYREGIAEVLVAMASTLQSVSAPAAALALLAAAARLREEIGGGAGWVGDAIERLRGSLRDSRGDATFESAWERGRALSTDEAIALALEVTELDA
ncbi:MAG TPA: tetratricopeptide repeat protein [Gaiellaceae bacterium]|jgi:predicted ATPase